MRHGQPPATPVLLVGEDVPVFFKTKLSPHQIGLCDVLASLEFTGKAPRHVAIIGIQPESMSLGMELSPAVAGKLPELVAMTVGELRGLGLNVEEKA